MASELENRARAAALSAMSGGTLGFADELYGYLSAVTPKSDNPALQALYAAQTSARLMPGQIPPIPDIEAYKAARDQYRTALAEGREKYPVQSFAAEMVGGIPLAWVPGMGQMNLAKSAALGAAYGLGESPSLDPKTAALYTGGGALGGAAIHGGIRGLEKGAKAVSPYAKAALERLAAANEGLGEAGAVMLPGGAPEKAAAPWYSRLERTLQEKMPEQANPEQVKNIISQGIPQEEVTYRGLDKFLMGKSGPVSKQEVMDYLAKNRVDLAESLRTETPPKVLPKPRPQYERPSGPARITPEVRQKADEMMMEEADKMMEDWYWDWPDGFGVETISSESENLARGAGQKDLFGNVIEAIPDKAKIKIDGEDVLWNDVPEYYAKKAVEDENGVAIFKDEDTAREAFYEIAEPYETSARDDAWREAKNSLDEDEFIAKAADELGVPSEEREIPEIPEMPEEALRPAKYKAYSTEGGENYRELLLRLPNPAKEKETAQLNEIIGRMQKLEDKVFAIRKKYGGEADMPEKTLARYNALIDKIEQAQNEYTSVPKAPTKYSSSHWEEPDVLAHLRLKDYKDPAGKKTLLIEEIQSDWHQAGRKKGYGLKEPEIDWETGNAQIDIINKELENIANAKEAAVRAGDQGRVRNLKVDYDSRMAQREAIIEKMKRKAGVEDAPFKKNWQEVAFKRALREAAEKDYDKLAWTTGEKQASRYSLSQEVNQIVSGAPLPSEDLRKVEILTKRGGNINLSVGRDGVVKEVSGSRFAELNGKPLDAIVGKSMADKIMNTNGVIEGEGLKIGGEGMKGFYDQILPSYANKYLKKFGVSVKSDKISLGQDIGGTTEVLDRAGNVVNRYGGSPHEVRNAELDAEKIGGTIRRVGAEPDVEEVHSVTLTPELKRAILKEGQPLWQVPTAVAAGALKKLSEDDNGSY